MIVPNRGYILIESGENEEKTESGIYLAPSQQKDRPETGIVVSVGEPELHVSGKLVSTNVQEGDEVIYKKWQGNEVNIDKTDKKRKFLIKFEDVMAIIKRWKIN